MSSTLINSSKLFRKIDSLLEGTLINFSNMLIKLTILLSCWKLSVVLTGGHSLTDTRGLSNEDRGCLPNTDD